MSRFVADLGNTRFKWAPVGPSGSLGPTLALPAVEPTAWASFAGRDAWPGSVWAIASVHPPLASRLGQFLRRRGVAELRWYRSATEVPITHELEHPETAGADRALGVAAALELHQGAGPGLVVSCGTAITVDRIAPSGTWQGGAIAPGLGLMARALHQGTAQLPQVDFPEAPEPWGRSTVPAIEAGLFWGTVGAVRELLTRQVSELTSAPWLVWTGGDAERLARWIEWPGSQIVPNLVLRGLARVAFGSEVADR